jgi:hypothetical protein
MPVTRSGAVTDYTRVRPADALIMTATAGPGGSIVVGYATGRAQTSNQAGHIATVTATAALRRPRGARSGPAIDRAPDGVATDVVSSRTAAAHRRPPHLPQAPLGRRGGGLELAAVLAHVAALLQPPHDAIQAGRVDAEVGGRVSDRDAGLLTDELQQLLLALAGRRSSGRTPAGRLGCGRRLARAGR